MIYIKIKQEKLYTHREFIRYKKSGKSRKEKNVLQVNTYFLQQNEEFENNRKKNMVDQKQSRLCLVEQDSNTKLKTSLMDKPYLRLASISTSFEIL